MCFNLLNSTTSCCASSHQFNFFGLRSNGGRVWAKSSSSTRSFFVLSTHSNHRIVKSNRKSRHGKKTVLNDDDDDLFSQDEVAELKGFDTEVQHFKSGKVINARLGYRQLKNDTSEKLLKNRDVVEILDGRLDAKHGIVQKGKFEDARQATNKVSERSFMVGDGRKKKTSNFSQNRFQKLSDELDLDEKWFPLLDYLSTFGLEESHFAQMFERHMPSLQINVISAQERLEFLFSVGVKRKDIRKILLRQPQILEYTVENNLKSHVAFLTNLGIRDSRIGQIITAAPSLFSYSVDQSLKPTVRYLVEEVGIKNTDLGKVIQLSPQILVQRIDVSWKSRFAFLSRELGAPRDKIVKMVTKHPQLLHYSIEDGILPRINFLRSIGMHNSDILKILTSLTQVLSLSLEDNLKPKYSYLVNELRNEVQSLTKYPTYLSLSLDQRIRPRHRFLVFLKKAPKGPFPLSSFVPTDERFCHSWAKTSLEKYLAFKQSLLLKEFAKKYERKR
ncbi:hypothetical protein Scep_012532 [Stephania cephalantha]|uniref:Transcription termination factor MTERF9, chloroplastic n=1 Tax=Stephania cephalantha TaxID=152367 RepID=A0AAP0JFA8_9MAGN